MPVGEPKQPDPLVEGIDYYIESGRWVFTEVYHFKRGYCCGSGCRHCPYRELPSRVELKEKCNE